MIDLLIRGGQGDDTLGVGELGRGGTGGEDRGTG